MQPTTNLGKHLGVPLFHGRSSKRHFQYVIDRMVNKLNGWKANTLSLVGRITLAQSALATIPSCLIQTIQIPISVCDNIDNSCRTVNGMAQTIRKRFI